MKTLFSLLLVMFVFVLNAASVVLISVEKPVNEIATPINPMLDIDFNNVAIENDYWQLELFSKQNSTLKQSNEALFIRNYVLEVAFNFVVYSNLQNRKHKTIAKSTYFKTFYFGEINELRVMEQ